MFSDSKPRQAELPMDAGTYSMLWRLAENQKIRVGLLGEFDFPAGEYIYIGSALGTGGLQARINRHFRCDTDPFWHIDWLKAEAKAEGGWYVTSERRLECIWAQSLTTLPDVSIPVPGFGSSDCQPDYRCAAHLVFSREGFNSEVVVDNLASAIGNCSEVVSF